MLSIHARTTPINTVVNSDTPAPTGHAVRLLLTHSYRYIAGMRLVTAVPTVLIASLVADRAPNTGATIAVLVAVAAWSLIYCVQLVRHPMTWITLVDAMILAGLALSAHWTVPLDWVATGKSWIVPFATFACVGYQYYASRLLGAAAAVIVVSGMVAGTVLASPVGTQSPSLRTAAWAAVIAFLTRVLWTLVHRGAVRADAAAADAEAARREQVVSEGIRQDEREHNRMLHDTAATTLLMVGTGQTHQGSLLSAQARRDISALQSHGKPLPAMSDLVEILGRGIAVVPILVEYRHPETLFLPTAIAQAVAGASEEALNNVARHAQVDSCTVTVIGDSHSLRVEIYDHGLGFDATAPSSGRGLRESILGRMEGIAGHADISSVVGLGTAVRLEWTRLEWKK